MKALVLEKYNSLIYKDVPDPEFGDEEVLVRVKYCGICGSDVHGLDGSTGRRIPPVIMGHEASGIIEKVGAAVTDYSPGDRVTFDSTVYPLNDWYTLQGRYNLSDNREVLGVSPGTYLRNGAFAELVAVPRHILYKIPENVTFEQAAMVEPVAVALHALSLAQMQVGESCLIVGAGMIGLFLVQAVSIAGASPVIAIDPDKMKMDLALRFGADRFLDPETIDIDNIIRDMTGGRGCDLAFEAVGKSQSVSTAIRLIRKGGRVILVGNLSPEITFPLQRVVTQEIKIQGSCAIRGEYEAALKLINSGKLKVDEMISAVAPLSEGASWFNRLYNREPGLNKVLLAP